MDKTQYELIEQKYGMLAHKVAHNISGDIATASHEDNVQEVWIAMIEAIRGYAKKENQTFDEFWGSVGFDKYIKTCMWNNKNSRGAKITKRYPLTKGVVDTHGNEEVLQMEDSSVLSAETEVFLQDIKKLLTGEQEKLVKLILDDPTYIKPSGKANVMGLSRAMGCSLAEATKIIKSIARKMENEL